MKEWYKEFVFVVTRIDASHLGGYSAYVTVEEQASGEELTLTVEDARHVKVRQQFEWVPSEDT